MTREEIIERGTRARALLENEIFMQTVNELLREHEIQTFATSPEDRETRETHYHQHVALQTIIGVLVDRVAKMEAAIEMADEDDEETED